MKNLTVSFLILIGTLSNLLAQKAEGILSLERIFTNNEFRSDWFGPARWIDEGEGYTTLENSKNQQGFLDIVRYTTSNGKREILIAAENLIPNGKEKPLYIENYHWSNDKTKLLIFTNSKRVWRTNTKGDYWVYNLATKSLQQLGGKKANPSSLMFAKFSSDASKVAYVREHNLFVENLTSKNIKALTNNGSDKIINGTFDWVYEEEFFCKDGFRWSPDDKKIAYWQLDASNIKNFLMINNTDSIYSKIVPVQYPKVGMPNSSCKVGVVSVDGGETKWMNVPGNPRENYIPRMEWAANSSELIIQHLNRRQDRNKITFCNASSGEINVIYTEKDDAWLDVVEDLKFLKGGKEFTWISEKSGWRSIYTMSRDGKKEKPITDGSFDIIDIKLIDQKNGWVYFRASPENATQKFLYRIKLNGKGKAIRITPQDLPGTHNYQISPNGKWAINTYSKSGVPPTISLVSLPNHTTARVLMSNETLKNKLEKINLSEKEFFKVNAKDGTSLDAFIMKPINFDSNKKYPVLFYVYGEPWNQTVVDSWGWNRFLYHQMLTQMGYIIMSVDNRGTPGPKGRKWRKSVHGQIGVLSSADQADAVNEIIKKFSFINEQRIGIWGWSGGGAMTLNAMFRFPEIYKTGISVAPVTNQLLYDNIYQERYSGLPSENMHGYIKGSPVNFAKNLKGNLMLIHGTGDDNVHYQHTEILINELVKHNKIFSLMSYPNRSHGIWEGEGTTRHLYETMLNYLKKNL